MSHEAWGSAAAQKEVDAFRLFLKKRDFKLTAQRNIIFQRILREDKHFSAEELFDSLKREKRSISKATIYRTLQLLVGARLLDQVDFDRGFKLYERTLGHKHHDHLICVECNRVVEFHDEELESVQSEVVSRYDFNMISHTHKIYGICSECRSRGVILPEHIS
jgi:Fur family transcriptional regulator, ferric uptake regulator